MKTVIYARLSNDSADPEAQLAPLRRLAKAKGLDVQAEYIDRAASDDWAGRRAWRRMLDDSQKENYDLLLVYGTDRIPADAENPPDLHED